MKTITPSRRSPKCRRGASTVEFALILPILFTFLIGSIEFARAKQVANSAAFSAYQGCRQAIIPGGSATAANSAAQQVLNGNSINSSTITISPATITDTTPTVTVTVAINLNSVGWISPMFTNGTTISRSCTLTREQTQ